MVEHQQSRSRLRGDVAELRGGGVGLRVVLLADWIERSEAGIGVHLVYQDIAAVAFACDSGIGPRVAADHDHLVRCADAVAERVLPSGMRHDKGANRHSRVGENFTLCNLVHISAVRAWNRNVALGDVLRIGIENAADHPLRSGRSVQLKRNLATLNPRREHHIVQPHRVIGMQMGDEEHPDARRQQCDDSAPRRGSCATDDTGACIKEVRDTVDHYRHRRPTALGIGNRGAGAEDDELRARRRLRVRRLRVYQCRDDGRDSSDHTVREAASGASANRRHRISVVGPSGRLHEHTGRAPRGLRASAGPTPATALAYAGAGTT